MIHMVRSMVYKCLVFHIVTVIVVYQKRFIIQPAGYTILLYLFVYLFHAVFKRVTLDSDHWGVQCIIDPTDDTDGVEVYDNINILL